MLAPLVPSVLLTNFLQLVVVVASWVICSSWKSEQCGGEVGAGN